MNQNFIFPIGHFLEQSIGKRELYSFEFPVDFEGIDTASGVEGQVEIMKLEDCFNVKLINVSIDVVLQCVKSLRNFTQNISFPMTERQFLMDSPKDIPDPFDLYLVDKKSLTIDISEMLRQEIILHFPPIPVCYDGGNELAESYAEEQKSQNKPLSALKDLIK